MVEKVAGRMCGGREAGNNVRHSALLAESSEYTRPNLFDNW